MFSSKNIFGLKRSIFLPGLFIFALIVASLLIPGLSPYSEDIRGAVHFEESNLSPSFSHYFGTDAAGRDIFTLTIRAALTSLGIGFGVVILAMFIGTPLGLIAGMKGKWIDEIIMRIVDGFLAFPPLVLPLVITSALGPSINNIVIGIAISWFPWYVRIARSQAIVLKNQDYVLASRSFGGSSTHIILKHVLPNSLPPIIVQASIDAGYAILVAAGLSFIGLGAHPPQVEWGLMITQAKAHFLDQWWTVTFPGLFIFMTVISFNLIGDGLRETLNLNNREE